MWVEAKTISNLEDETVASVVTKIKAGHPKLLKIDLSTRENNEDELHQLMDALLTYPNEIWSLGLPFEVSARVGIKLARFIAKSQTIQSVNARLSEFTEATFLAIAAALRVNSSVSCLHLYGSRLANTQMIKFAFVDALRYNPARPVRSRWALWNICNSWEPDDFCCISKIVSACGRFSLTEILYFSLDECCLG